MDADFSHDPIHLPQFLGAIEDADLVLGSRYQHGRVTVVNWPIARLILSYFANVYARAVTGLPVWDATGGFKCFRRSVLEAIDLSRVRSNGYAFQIEMSYRAWKRGFRIAEIPIVFVDRTGGDEQDVQVHRPRGGLDGLASALVGAARHHLGGPATRYPGRPSISRGAMLPSGRTFYKMSGSGNDFVVVDATRDPPGRLAEPAVVQALCARATGIGADGVVFLEPSQAADYRMTYLNSDGSRADLCGNASLCSARLATELGIVHEPRFQVETDAGILGARLLDGIPEVDLQPVTDIRPGLPFRLEAGERWIGFALAGVPHLVVRVEDVATVDVVGRGRPLRHDASLPQGANVNFVSPKARRKWLANPHLRARGGGRDAGMRHRRGRERRAASGEPGVGRRGRPRDALRARSSSPPGDCERWVASFVIRRGSAGLRGTFRRAVATPGGRAAAIGDH